MMVEISSSKATLMRINITLQNVVKINFQYVVLVKISATVDN